MSRPCDFIVLAIFICCGLLQESYAEQDYYYNDDDDSYYYDYNYEYDNLEKNVTTLVPSLKVSEIENATQQTVIELIKRESNVTRKNFEDASERCAKKATLFDERCKRCLGSRGQKDEGDTSDSQKPNLLPTLLTQVGRTMSHRPDYQNIVYGKPLTVNMTKVKVLFKTVARKIVEVLKKIGTKIKEKWESLTTKIRDFFINIKDSVRVRRKFPRFRWPRLRLPRFKIKGKRKFRFRVRVRFSRMKRILPRIRLTRIRKPRFKRFLPRIRGLRKRIKVPRIKTPRIRVRFPRIRLPRIRIRYPRIRLPRYRVRLPRIRTPRFRARYSRFRTPRFRIRYPRIRTPRYRVRYRTRYSRTRYGRRWGKKKKRSTCDDCERMSNIQDEGTKLDSLCPYFSVASKKSVQTDIFLKNITTEVEKGFPKLEKILHHHNSSLDEGEVTITAIEGSHSYRVQNFSRLSNEEIGRAIGLYIFKRTKPKK